MTCPLFTLVDRNGGWEKIGERERERDRKKERKKKRRKIFDFVTIQVENERFVAAYESSVFSLSLSLSLSISLHACLCVSSFVCEIARACAAWNATELKRLLEIIIEIISETYL